MTVYKAARSMNSEGLVGFACTFLNEIWAYFTSKSRMKRENKPTG